MAAGTSCLTLLDFCYFFLKNEIHSIGSVNPKLNAKFIRFVCHELCEWTSLFSWEQLFINCDIKLSTPGI